MRTLKIIFILLILFFISNCGQRHIALMTKTSKDYSVEIESHIENVFLDGLPNGIDIAHVNKVLLKQLDDKIAENGLNDKTKDTIKAKYEIEYFAHKFRPPKPKFLITYKLELSRELNGNIIYSEKHESWDSDLIDLIEEVSNDIIEIILKNEKYYLTK